VVFRRGGGSYVCLGSGYFQFKLSYLVVSLQMGFKTFNFSTNAISIHNHNTQARHPRDLDFTALR
jgi:hypothetical protein